MNEAIEEIRELKTEVRIKQDELGRLADMLKNHPAKPQAGDKPDRIKRWALTREPIDRRREELKKEVGELLADITDLRQDLNQEPLDGRKISMVIDRLTEIEALFTTAGADAAWDRLTSLTDWLETLEASS